MSWFGKKEEDLKGKRSELPELPKLPEIPKLSKLPELPRTSYGLDSPEIQAPHGSTRISETRPLPAFPGKLGEDFSQEAVKSAVSPPADAELYSKSPENLMKGKRTLEIAEWEGSTPPQQTESMLPPDILSRTNIPKPKLKMPLPTREKGLTRKTEPVYVRIDKFKSAVKSFEEIKSKVRGIESLLEKIRETKQKEEDELRGWEQELEIIKARIDSIDSTIFSKLD